MKRVKTWLYKPMNIKLFVGSVFTMVIFYLLYLLVLNIYDTDMYFIIATGREIIKNGIIHTNVWTIDSDSAIVVQQWLYDVILAYVDKCGILGFTLFVGIELIILCLLMVKFFSIKHLSFGTSSIGIFITLMFSQIYIFSLRPEIVTLILLLGECIALEKYRETSKYRWLIWLPILMLIEINMHASMWPIHFAILLAYMVPSFYMPGVIKNDIHKAWKPILISVLFMICSMFINPYGVDNVLYVIKSYVASTFDYVKVVEIMQPDILSACGLSIIIGCSLLFLCTHFKVLCSTSTNIACGFMFLATTAVRHNMFAFFILLFLLRDLGCYIDTISSNVDWKKDVKNYLYPFLIVGNIFIFGLFYFGANNMFGKSDDSVGTQLSNIYDYVVENSEDAHMFTGFNCGAYFEYKGLHNIYIDARPELYTSEFTGDKNILRDYSRYALYGYSTVEKTEDDLSLVTQDEMDDWFYSYDFDYVLVTVKSEMNLAAYMRTNENYHMIDSLSGPTYVFYEKN